jgi:hypothetical protein
MLTFSKSSLYSDLPSSHGDRDCKSQYISFCETHLYMIDGTMSCREMSDQDGWCSVVTKDDRALMNRDFHGAHFVEQAENRNTSVIPRGIGGQRRIAS